MSSRGRPPGLFAAALAIARKELVESYRDRQMLLYGLGVPLALYPVLFWLMIQASLIVRGKSESTLVRVAVCAPSAEAIPDALLAELRDAVRGEHSQVELAELRELDDQAARALVAEASGEDREQDAVLYLYGDGRRAVLFHDSTDGRSEMARERLRERLPDFVVTLREEAVRARDADPELLRPVAVRNVNVAPEESMGAYLLSFVLPMMLVIMTVMGAFFPAVDLTAGEKERGTMETTLILCVPRMSLYLGKILAVCATACLACTLNLVAMAISAGHLLSMLDTGKSIQIDLPLRAFLLVAPLALLFAFFVSAVMTAVASLSKTFKEGQALLGPMQLLFFLPAMATAVPAIQLTPALALVPVLNVVLGFKMLLRGEFLPLEFGLCAVSLVAYAFLALKLALSILSRESLQFSSKEFSPARLLRALRS